MTAKTIDTAAIEVGLDAVRLLIGRVQKPATRASSGRTGGRSARSRSTSPVKHVDSRVRPLSGDGGSSSGPEEAVAVVARYLRLAERAGAPVALAARAELAQVAGGQAILQRLRGEIPDPVRLISPRRQVQLVFDAVRPALDPETPELLVSLEGHATQLVIASDAAVSDTRLLPFGPASIAVALPDPPTPLEWALEAMRLGESLAEAGKGFAAGSPARIFVVGEGAEALGAFDAVRGDKAPVNLSLADLDRMSDEVVRASSRKIARRTGEDPRRIALLAPGALILAALLTRYGLSRCTLLPQGLRDGIVLAAAANSDGWWREESNTTPASFDVAAPGG